MLNTALEYLLELSKIVKGSNLQKLFNLLIKNMIVTPCSNFASSRDRSRLRSQVSNSAKGRCPKCFLVQNNFEAKVYYRTENDIYRYISANFFVLYKYFKNIPISVWDF